MLNKYLTSYILLCTCPLKKQRQNKTSMTKHIDQKEEKQVTREQNILFVLSQIQRNTVNSMFDSLVYSRGESGRVRCRFVNAGYWGILLLLFTRSESDIMG